MSRMKKVLVAFLVFSFPLFASLQIEDPYEWLEDVKSTETAKWVQIRNTLSQSYLKQLPEVEKIREKLRSISDYETRGFPIQKEGRLFFFMREKGTETSKLVLQEPTGEKQVLITPDSYAPLVNFEVSEDGKFVAYAVSNAGADQQVWKFLNVETGERLPDQIEGIQFTNPIWSSDNQGLYYISYKETAIYYHQLGAQEDHLLLPLKKDAIKLLLGLCKISDKTLLVQALDGFSRDNAVYLLDLENIQAKELIPFGQGEYQYIGEIEGKLLFLTDHHANRKQLVAYQDDWKSFIPESSETLINATIVDSQIICHYLKDCVAVIKRFDPSGQFIDYIPLPGKGSAALAPGKPFFSYTDVATPRAIYHYKNGIWFQPQPETLTDIVTEQLFFLSKDGTNIPLAITYRKGTNPTGNHPTLLYGYGGFNIPLTPSYSPLIATWLDFGGLFVTVNLRGGGEYGKEWHEAGIKENKQNVFDDFIAAAEFLIENNYTCSDKLAIHGSSNGGLLVGACLVQRPDLFGAVIPQVGVLDMLKFHQFTIGWAWIGDYGNPDKPEDFPYLLAYSPYHNVKQGISYPPTLIITADHDDRVVPLHSYKFAARLTESHIGQNPILLRVYEKTGHGQKCSLEQLIQEYTDILSFLIQTLELPNPRL